MTRLEFFRTADRHERLLQAAGDWIDTPFAESTGAKARPGVASDCCSCVAMTLQRVGAIGGVPWPERYVSRGGGRAMLDIMVSVLSGIPRLLRIWDAEDGQPMPELVPGDLVVVSTGTALHHLALYLGANRILHSWDGRARLGSVADHARLAHSLWRAYE